MKSKSAFLAIACVILAAGGVLLLRSAPQVPSGQTPATVASGDSITASAMSMIDAGRQTFRYDTFFKARLSDTDKEDLVAYLLSL